MKKHWVLELGQLEGDEVAFKPSTESLWRPQDAGAVINCTWFVLLSLHDNGVCTCQKQAARAELTDLLSLLKVDVGRSVQPVERGVRHRGDAFMSR